MKIIFAGTPEFALPSLQSLIHSEHKVIAVYTQPDRPAGRGRKLTASPVKQIALQYHIPIHQPISLKDPEVQETLIKLNAEVMIVVAYGLLIPKTIIDHFKQRCINIHPSLLPRWRGASPIQAPILAGDKETGTTIIEITKGLDSGPIYKQISCPITPQDTFGSLHDKLANISAKALLEVLTNIESIKPIEQDENLSTYANKITKEQTKIDWNQSANQIERTVRAFNPAPGAFCEFQQQPLKIWQAKSYHQMTNEKPGTIITVNKESIVIATGKGTLELLQCQLPGAKPISARDFINAHQNLLKQVLQ